MRRRRRRKGSFRFKFKIKLFFIIIIAFVLLLWLLTRSYFQPTIISYAKQKSILYSSMLINNAIRDQILTQMDIDKLVIIDSNENGLVSSVQLNTYEANKMLAYVTEQIVKELLEIEKDRNSELNKLSVPLGVIFNNPIFSKYGPNIAIHLVPIGSVKTDIVSSVTPYGINNTLIEVILETTVTFQVIIPFQKDEINVVAHTPILVKVITGEVPRYYYQGGTSVPIPRIDDDNGNGDNDMDDIETD